MFERFADRAQRVIVLAQEEARLLNHQNIGTEHILLGMIHEGEGVAAQALTALGVDLQRTRDEIEEIIGKGEHPPTGHMPFTPRAKNLLDLSLRESLGLGHNCIGTEHVLLGLVREGEGVGAQVLVKQGVTLEALREKVIEILSGPPAGAADPSVLGVSQSSWNPPPWKVLLTETDVTALEASEVDFLPGWCRITPVDPVAPLQVVPAWRVRSVTRERDGQS